MKIWPMSPYLILCCVCVISCSVISNSLQPHGLQSARLLCPWGFSRQEYWSGLPCLPLQGIFPTQESNPGLLHYRWTFYHLSYQGSPRILEWVTYPFSRGSSQPRDWILASHIAGRFFTVWATKETLLNFKRHQNCQKIISLKKPMWRILLGMSYYIINDTAISTSSIWGLEATRRQIFC